MKTGSPRRMAAKARGASGADGARTHNLLDATEALSQIELLPQTHNAAPGGTRDDTAAPAGGHLAATACSQNLFIAWAQRYIRWNRVQEP